MIAKRQRTAGTVTRVFNSLFLSSTQSICSEGACILQGSSDFDRIPFAPESGSNATFWVGYFANSFEVHFDGFEGASITQQPIPFVFEELCSENCVRVS